MHLCCYHSHIFKDGDVISDNLFITWCNQQLEGLNNLAKAQSHHSNTIQNTLNSKVDTLISSVNAITHSVAPLKWAYLLTMEQGGSAELSPLDIILVAMCFSMVPGLSTIILIWQQHAGRLLISLSLSNIVQNLWVISQYFVCGRDYIQNNKIKDIFPVLKQNKPILGLHFRCIWGLHSNTYSLD